jgi:hypothetical protein
MIESIQPLARLSVNGDASVRSTQTQWASGGGEDQYASLSNPVQSAINSSHMMRLMTRISGADLEAIQKRMSDDRREYQRKAGRKEARALTELGAFMGQDVRELVAGVSGKKAIPNMSLASSQQAGLQIKIDLITGVLKKSSETLQKLASSQ